MDLSNEFTTIEPVLGIRGRRVGDDYEYQVENPGVLFLLTNIREDRGDARVEMHIKSIQPGNEGDILRDRVYLTNSRQKGSLAATLRGRTKVNGMWEQIVEAICNATVDDFRRGEPVLTLANVPQRNGVAYLVNCLLPMGEPTVLYGDGMSAKSLTAMFLAVAVATATDLPGFNALAQATPVMYLDWETNAVVQRRRLDLVCTGLGVTTPNNLYYRYMTRGLADDIRAIQTECDRRQVSFVIVDSMAPACAGEPESAEVVLRLFNALRTLDGVTKLLISHITKVEATGTGVPRPFGSIFTTNLARSTWAIRRTLQEESEQISIALFHTKTNDGMLFGARGLRYCFSDDMISIGKINPSEVPELMEHAPLTSRIRGVLKKGAMDIEAIAEELGASGNSIRVVLNRMPDATVVEPGGGRGKKSLWGLAAHQDESDDGPF